MTDWARLEHAWLLRAEGLTLRKIPLTIVRQKSDMVILLMQTFL